MTVARATAAMGLTISSLFSRLFGKKQMRILMGECAAGNRGRPGVCAVASNSAFPGQGGGGRPRRILRGNNGGEGRAVSPTDAEPDFLALGFACSPLPPPPFSLSSLSLPDLIESPRRRSGDPGLVHPGEALSKGAIFRSTFVAMGSGRE